MNLKHIFFLFKKIENLFEKISKSLNPDFYQLKNQYRLVVSRILMENGYYNYAIQILLMAIENFQFELQIRLGHLKEKSKKYLK